MRLALAGELLLLVVVTLLLGTARTIDGTLCAIIGGVLLLAVGALLFAIVGERPRGGRPHA